MKIEKNKIVFTSVLILILLFLIGYSMLILEKGDASFIDDKNAPIPELEGGHKEYESRLEALEDLKDEREVTAPSIYPDHMVDDKGFFNPDYMEYEKQRIIDSIHTNEQRRFEEIRSSKNESLPDPIYKPITETKNLVQITKENDSKVLVKERSLEHQLFFASHPLENNEGDKKELNGTIKAQVDGRQAVKKDYRLQMRLLHDIRINNVLVPRNTPIYGFVSFKPNRVIIAINNIGHVAVKLKAYDYQDGNEGIYIENSFRAEAINEVTGDIVEDINIAGVPQIRGVKKIFQKNNRNVKVTISDNYKLLLKFK